MHVIGLGTFLDQNSPVNINVYTIFAHDDWFAFGRWEPRLSFHSKETEPLCQLSN